jgi:hypothetical protein
MNLTIEFFRVRSTDDSHATLDRISVIADNLEAAKVKAKSLFETLDMPHKRTDCASWFTSNARCSFGAEGTRMPKP